MSGRGPDGPAAIDESAFRSNVREAVRVWRERLVAAPAPNECAAIGSEAADLRRLAESRGWWALAQHLEIVETLSRESPATLRDAVATLGRRVAVSDEASPFRPRSGEADGGAVKVGDVQSQLARSIALPPLLADPLPSRAGPALPPSLASTANRQPSADIAPRPAPAPDPVRVPASPVPMAASPSPAPPKLLVKNMLGLNAFGRKRGDESADRDRVPAFVQKPPPLSRPPPLGGPFSASAPAPAEARPGRQSSRPAPLRAPLAKEASGPRRPGSGPLRIRESSARVPTWFYVLAGGVVLLAFATVLIVVVSSPSEKKLDPRPHVEVAAAAPAATTEAATAGSGSQDAPHVEVHFGEESERLRAVIDAQSRLAASCRGESCRNRWTAFAREAMDARPTAIALERAPAAEPLSGWLLKLKKPSDFPLVEDPLLKGTFDYDAKHVVGHQQFQNTLRRCSAYADIIEGALLKYGAPTWLTAVVYQESQCDPQVRSPAGALGLWQFMPDSARAYDLQVIEDEVDERMNPVKATDAGVRFLTDLHRKLGAWDLALAAYNAGPYGVAARIAQVGGHAGFWDLVRSGLLPDETARYVPAIEAHALVLWNLARLDFMAEGQREDATEVRARPGTRLSLIARAANTSTQRIHELNLDFLRSTVPNDVVPNKERPVRVPTSEAERAQDFLDHVNPNDKRDTCVPKDFDWGRADFSPYAANCGRAGP